MKSETNRRKAVLLAGGIGTGKSAVARGFAQRGAYVIDTDRIARTLQEPGGWIVSRMAEILGDDILDEQGRLDRATTAERLFGDGQRRQEVNALVHPRVWERVDALIAAAADIGIVVVESAVLPPDDKEFEAVIAVDAPRDAALQRLITERGYSLQDAMARQAAQLSLADNRLRAGWVVRNHGSRDQLEREITRAWQWLVGVTSSYRPSQL